MFCIFCRSCPRFIYTRQAAFKEAALVESTDAAKGLPNQHPGKTLTAVHCDPSGGPPVSVLSGG
jgi:hypothetical protein